MPVSDSRSVFLADEAATLSLGASLGASLGNWSEGLVIFLEGDLGAGKTTFCRGVLRGLGHSGAVKSPTYTLVEPYEFDGRTLNHFDLYRLGDPEELEYMGIRDYFKAGDVCIIEWPERGAGVLPEPDLRVTVTVEGRGRRFRWQSETLSGARWLNHWPDGDSMRATN